MTLANGMNIISFLVLSVYYRKSKMHSVPAGHVHTLTFRVSGTKIICPSGSDKPLVSTPGSITYLPHGVPYRVDDFEEGHMYSVHFDLAEECDASPFVFTPKSPIEYENLFRTLFEQYRVGNDRDYRCLSLLYGLLAKIRDELGEESRHAMPKRIRTAIERINRSYDDPSLSVSSLASEAGVSDVYFRQEFKSCTGLAPIEYIRKIRLENARAMLGTSLYPIGEVATRCGFDSISYFSEQFRKMYGVPPSKYRRSPENEKMAPEKQCHFSLF